MTFDLTGSIFRGVKKWKFGRICLQGTKDAGLLSCSTEVESYPELPMTQPTSNYSHTQGLAGDGDLDS